jgi:short-subunit dehydrogenase
MTYTLITGAGSGLGKEFALQCARLGHNMILVDLPGSHIRSLARDLINSFGIDAQVFEFDLTESWVLRHKMQYIMATYTINFLINNAGTGGSSSITSTPLERIDQIIQLNVRSTALLTHLLLPHLIKNRNAYILNVSSMAAFTPIAYKTVYPASKAFISSFALGLREELSGTGVSISVLYPGPIMTNSGTTQCILLQGRKARLGLLSTAAIASMALRKTLARQPVIIPGAINRISHWLMQWLPLNIKLRLVSREVKRELVLQNQRG